MGGKVGGCVVNLFWLVLYYYREVENWNLQDKPIAPHESLANYDYFMMTWNWEEVGSEGVSLNSFNYCSE